MYQMIRNFQKTSSGSNVDLSPIYLSLQTINNLLYSLDVQTTIPNALISISQDIGDISEKVDNLSQQENHVYITNSALTTNLYLYNSYPNLQSTGPVEIYEPYVQSITNPDYLKGRAYFKYNLPNATLNYVNESEPIEYEEITCNVIKGNDIECTQCKINTISVKDCDLFNVTAQYVNADTGYIDECDINTIEIKSQGTIDNCLIKNANLTGCKINSCYGYSIRGDSNEFEECTLCYYPNTNQTFNKIKLNAADEYINCSFNSASLYDLNNTNFMACSGLVYIPKFINGVNMFDDNNDYLGGILSSNTYNTYSTYTRTVNVSWTYEQTAYPSYTETYTNDSGYYTTNSTSYKTIDISFESTFTIYPDTTNIITQTNYTTTYDTYKYTETEIITVTATGTDGEFTHTMASMWPVTDTYTETCTTQIYDTLTTTLTSEVVETSTLRTTTETITSSYYTSLSTYDPVLNIKLLPEYVIPNIYTNNGVKNQYYNTYINIEQYTNSLNNFTVNSCTGNYDLYLTNLENSFDLTNNNFYKLNLNIDNVIGNFKVISNTVKDANIIINSEILSDMNINSNSFDRLNISYNHTQTRNILAYNNTYDYLNIMPNVNGYFRMWNCVFNNGYLNGYVALNFCTANYIENSGEEHFFRVNVNTLREYKLNDLRSNTIGKLIIDSGIDDNPNKTFDNNSIGTIVCPANYTITNLTDNNTFDSIVTY